jgi:hypothetical protein
MRIALRFLFTFSDNGSKCHLLTSDTGIGYLYLHVKREWSWALRFIWKQQRAQVEGDKNTQSEPRLKGIRWGSNTANGKWGTVMALFRAFVKVSKSHVDIHSSFFTSSGCE